MSTRKKILIGFIAFFVVVFIVGAISGGSSSNSPANNSNNNSSSTSSTNSSTSSSEATQTLVSKIGIAQDKSFALIAIKFSNDGLGDGQATARIQNISNTTKSGIFEVTIFESDGVTPALTLQGSADGITSGQTTTVDLITTDGALPTGKFTYAFQVGSEF